MIDLECDLILWGVVLDVVLGQFASDHGGDKLRLPHGLAVEHAHVQAVPEHFDMVGYLEQFLHAVGDVDDADVAGGERPYDAEQDLHFLLGQGGGRLVHHDDPAAEGDRPDDLDDLLLGDGQGTQFGGGVEVQPVLVDDRLRLGDLFLERDDAGGIADLVAHEDVFGDGYVAAEHQLLMDDADAVLAGVRNAVDLDVLALDADLPGVHRVDAAEDLDQRRFASAVFAQQGEDFTRMQGDVDVFQHLVAAEALVDIAHLHQYAHDSLLCGRCSMMPGRRRPGITANRRRRIRRRSWRR